MTTDNPVTLAGFAERLGRPLLVEDLNDLDVAELARSVFGAGPAYLRSAQIGPGYTRLLTSPAIAGFVNVFAAADLSTVWEDPCLLAGSFFGSDDDEGEVSEVHPGNVEVLTPLAVLSVLAGRGAVLTELELAPADETVIGDDSILSAGSDAELPWGQLSEDADAAAVLMPVGDLYLVVGVAGASQLVCTGFCYQIVTLMAEYMLNLMAPPAVEALVDAAKKVPTTD
jgi:hypothetical protein